MKKVLLFVLAAFFACYTMNAQTLLSEGFESGIPATWSTIDNDGDGNNWLDGNTYLTGLGANPASYVHDGSSFAISISYDQESNASYDADNYLITPQINVPASGAALKFYVRSILSNYPDDYMVKLSTTGNSNASDFSVTLKDLETAEGDWTLVELSLADYAGQSVYVAFVHQTYNMFALAIDDVVIEEMTTAPEISLLSINSPNAVNPGTSVNITGTVKNLSGSALTAFDVVYTYDGTTSSTYTVSGINVAYGETYDFTHNVPVTVAVGNHTLNVTVSNPNGVADNTEDNTLSSTITGCGVVTSLPLTQDFENGIGCWTTYSANTENEEMFGVQSVGGSATSGDYVFVFSSYEEADDYSQYLISPELSLPSAAELSFYHICLSQYSGGEKFQVMVSTTTNDPASFTEIGDEITSTYGQFTEATAVIAQNVKYIAIKYTSEYEYYLGIDEISLTAMSSDPEIALTTITTPRSATEGNSVNVSGVVTNNSGAALTSFDVAYTFDGAASATYNVTGINVAAGETYAFTHNDPITNITGGEHTLVVTVSNPNATADNTADNSLSITILGCGQVNAPFSESFDNGMGCWSAIDEDGDGNNWMSVSDLLTSLGSTSLATNYTHSGNDAMVSESFSNSTGVYDANNWLISPAIVMPATGAYAAKWFDKASYGDAYKVYVGTSSDIATLAAGTPLYSGVAESDYTERGISLTDYSGQTIYIAFNHEFSDGFWLFIDDFSIEEVSTTPEIALTSASAPATVAMNTAYVVNGTITNNCATAITSFDVACTVNGQTTNQQITGINVPYLQSYNFTVDMPGIATANTYDITVTVSNPNGVADNTTDNTQTTSVNIYDASNSVPRTVLLENFTTAVCPNCPNGHQYIEQALNGVDNVIWVAHHAGYNTDALTIDLDNTMCAFFNGNYTWAPALMLDRTYYTDSWSSGIDNSGSNCQPALGPAMGVDAANGISTALSKPAFVTVNLSGLNYNATTRALSVTVSGNVTGALGTTDARLNVWLLEDGLLADGGTGVGHGPSQSGASGTFYHNHVIRENLSGDDWGEAGIVNPTSGNYTKTYTTTVSNNYDASKCYIVAFVSNGDHSNINDCRVFNAGKSAYLTNEQPGPGPQPQGIDDVNAMNVKLFPNPTTGNLYIEVEGLQKVEVIDAVGRVVMSQNNGNVVNMSNLANGIYTVRVMANGNTAVKKVVKK